MDAFDTPAAPARDAAAPLTYEGTDIRQRGLMLNLTDMWRAAGGPAYRRPTLWLDMEETKRFRTYVRWRWSNIGSYEPDLIVTHGDIKRAEPDGLVLTTRGQRGETWAHWQLALSYARHLSLPFTPGATPSSAARWNASAVRREDAMPSCGMSSTSSNGCTASSTT